MKNFNNNMFTSVQDVSTSGKKKAEKVGVEKKYWIEQNGVDYLYKIDDSRDLGFGELFCSHIARKVGFDCVNVYPAIDKAYDTKGVMVQSFLTPEYDMSRRLSDIVEEYDKLYMDPYSRYSVEEFLRLEKKLAKDKIYFAPDCITKLKQMVLADFMLGQVDRHLGNIEMLFHTDKTTGKTYITPAPMFDNGRMLGLAQTDNILGSRIESYRAVPCLVMFARQDGQKEIVTECAAYSLLEEMERDPALYAMYQKFKELDIAKEIEYVCEQTGYTLAPEQIRFMEQYFETRISMIDECVMQKMEDPKDYHREHTKSPARFPLRKPWKKLIEKHEKKIERTAPTILTEEKFVTETPQQDSQANIEQPQNYEIKEIQHDREV